MGFYLLENFEILEFFVLSIKTTFANLLIAYIYYPKRRNSFKKFFNALHFIQIAKQLYDSLTLLQQKNF